MSELRKQAETLADTLANIRKERPHAIVYGDTVEAIVIFAAEQRAEVLALAAEWRDTHSRELNEARALASRSAIPIGHAAVPADWVKTRDGLIEQCAKVCDQWATQNHVYVNGAIRCAEDIRALKTKP